MHDNAIEKLTGVHQILYTFSRDKESEQSDAFFLLANEIEEVIKELSE